MGQIKQLIPFFINTRVFFSSTNASISRKETTILQRDNQKASLDYDEYFSFLSEYDFLYHGNFYHYVVQNCLLL